MPEPLILPRFSVGVGDRFAHQARRSCGRACWPRAAAWRWSRCGTSRTASTRSSARSRAACGPRPTPRCGSSAGRSRTTSTPTTSASKPWIASSPPCDFYTIDVADSIGQPADPAAVRGVRRPARRTGRHDRHSRHRRRRSTSRGRTCERIAGKYLKAVQDAGRIYRKIAAAKGADNFITEVSMDETDTPADAAGIAADPRRARGRGRAGADHRPEVHRPVQQGRRLRRRPARSSRRSSATTWR